ncbi:hypothetical protein Tco_1500264 [Tanacetum coccineum]
MILKYFKAKVERKSLALKAKTESMMRIFLGVSILVVKTKKFAWLVRDLLRVFKRNRVDSCEDPNHLIRECPKPPRDKNQRAFVGGSWRDSGEEDDEKIQDETCLVAQAPNEVCFESSYFSDENSSIDDLALDNEYDKLCKMSLKIITKNKRLKSIRNSLENGLKELKDKLSILEKNKGVDPDCAKCHTLKIENEKLKEESTRLNKFEMSTHCLNEMLNNQKPFGDKLGLGFNSFEASSSGTKEIKFVRVQKMTSFDGGFNLLSIGQICDNKCRVTFSEHDNEITKDGKVIGHANMRYLYNSFVASKELVQETYYGLELSPHGNLFGPSIVRSYGGNRYTLVIVDDYSRITCEGACVFSDRWSLDELVYGAPSEGPYQTNLPSPDDIISYVREDKEGQVTRIRHQEEIKVQDYQILTREIVNFETFGGNNLGKYSILPISWQNEWSGLLSKLERKPRRDCGTRRGRHSTSSSSTFDQPSSSHLNDDDDDGNDEGTSRASTPSPICYVNSLTNQVPQVFQNPSNVDQNMEPFYTRQTKILNRQVQLRDEHRGGVSQVSLFFLSFQNFKSSLLLNVTSSPQPLNPLLENILDVPPRPLNPQPLQSHPSLDITFSLSPITPLDHIHDTPSPPSSPQPQPPIMGHPLLYNYHDYHGSTCICCFHNRNLHLNLRDEMNIMFAYLEYLLTTALTTHFPPPP